MVFNNTLLLIIPHSVTVFSEHSLGEQVKPSRGERKAALIHSRVESKSFIVYSW